MLLVKGGESLLNNLLRQIRERPFNEEKPREIKQKMENLHVVKIHILLCNAVALLSTSVGFLCSSQVMFGNKSKSN